MKLSIIIVNYNVKYFLKQCLHSVLEAIEDIDAEVFVVDNNSSDGSVEMLKEKFPSVKLIENKENTGFAKANNQAIREASGEYILLLNPDTLVESETFRKSVQFMDDHDDAGALGVKMLNGKGEFLPESKRGLPLPNVAFYKIFGLAKLFPKSKKFGSYHLTYLAHDKTHAVEVLSGAFMMLRKSVLDKIGYLDEDYFMYGEDIDLSYRIIQNGYKNYYYPETKIIHYKGESTKKDSINYVIVFYKAMQIFVKKHFSDKGNHFFNRVMDMGIWLRAFLSILKRCFIKIIPPIIDLLVILIGLYALSAYWEWEVLSFRNAPPKFPPVYRQFVIPLYAVVWTFFIALCKGYKKPMRMRHINKGILIGTAIILFVYALLPETFRFSRAVLLFGSAWTIIALNAIRYLFHKLHIKSYSIENKSNKRIAIIGNLENSEKLAIFTRLLNPQLDFCGIILLIPNARKSHELQLGNIGQVDEIITKYGIEEIIFSEEDMAVGKIIHYMEKLQPHHIEFKIASCKELTVIGSRSIFAAKEAKIRG